MRSTCFARRIAFSCEQAERVFVAAERLGLPVKMHAEQLSLMGGAALSPRGTVPYLPITWNFSDEAGVVAMRDAGTVAVLLPGAFYLFVSSSCRRSTCCAVMACRIALSTDSNPGTSPTTSLLLMLNMGCTLFRMTVAEVLAGVTDMRRGRSAMPTCAAKLHWARVPISSRGGSIRLRVGLLERAGPLRSGRTARRDCAR